MLGVIPNLQNMSSRPYTYEDIVGFADFIKAKINIAPTIGIVCGSGQGSVAETVEDAVLVPYKDIPNFPVSTVQGHKGQFVIGKLGGKSVILMQGRFHLYEGYAAWQVATPVRVMFLLGVRTMIVGNAAGGLNRDYKVGDFMLIKDHINMPGLAGVNPLQGANEEKFGPRFVNMSDAYSKDLRTLAKKIGKELGYQQHLHEGVYVMVAGPSYETPAELRFLMKGGADVVGMSTAPEVIVARHCGISCLGISLVTNCCILENDKDLITDHEEVLGTGKKRADMLKKFITGIVERLDNEAADCKESNGI